MSHICKIHEFMIPIYRIRCFLVVTNDFSKHSKRMADIFGNEDLSGYQAVVTFSGKEMRIQFNPNEINREVVAHEIFHLAHRALDFCGMKLTNGSQEAFAYLIGWLTEEIYKKLKEWGVEVK